MKLLFLLFLVFGFGLLAFVPHLLIGLLVLSLLFPSVRCHLIGAVITCRQQFQLLAVLFLVLLHASGIYASFTTGKFSAIGLLLLIDLGLVLGLSQLRIGTGRLP